MYTLFCNTVSLTFCKHPNVQVFLGLNEDRKQDVGMTVD